MALPQNKLSLVDAALDAAADPAVPTSAVLGQALRVARLAADAEALIWCSLELNGIADNTWRDALLLELESVVPTREELERIWHRTVERWMVERKVDGGDAELFLGDSPAEIEAHTESLKEILARPNLPPDAEGPARMRLAHNRTVLARVRQRTVNHLTRINDKPRRTSLLELRLTATGEVSIPCSRISRRMCSPSSRPRTAVWLTGHLNLGVRR